jgi:hypothetical protein
MGLNMAAGLGGMLKDGHKHIEGVYMDTRSFYIMVPWGSARNNPLQPR